MFNKYLYSFQKDVLLRKLCILSAIGVVFCLVLFRISIWQSQALKDIQIKQALIAQIPALQARVGQTKVQANGLVLTLNGIISHKGQLMAIINNTFVKIGDNIEGKKVVSITGHSAGLCDVRSVDKCITLLIE